MRIMPCAKTYGGVKVLNFPGAELQPGQIVGIIGANGSGKSTLAKILSGVLKGDEKVTLEGRVGYLPQKPHAFRMTVLKNVLLGGQDREKAKRILASLGLSALENQRADRLSGGETARMALARLLMKDFDLLILDEPTAAMDMETTLLAEKLVQDYVRQTACAAILVTHSLQQARRLADTVWYFDHGRLAESGPVSCLDAPETEELRKFMEFYGI